jgi:hypothetical protein
MRELRRTSSASKSAGWLVTPRVFCWLLAAQDVCASVQVLRAVRLLFLWSRCDLLTQCCARRAARRDARPDSGVRQFCSELLDCDPPPCGQAIDRPIPSACFARHPCCHAPGAPPPPPIRMCHGPGVGLSADSHGRTAAASTPLGPIALGLSYVRACFCRRWRRGEERGRACGK